MVGGGSTVIVRVADWFAKSTEVITILTTVSAVTTLGAVYKAVVGLV